MPITTSAKKALRQNVRHRAVNLAKKEAYKDAVRDFKKLVADKKMDEAKKQLNAVYQSLDKAAKTNVIMKNTAARIKSRMSSKLKVKA